MFEDRRYCDDLVSPVSGVDSTDPRDFLQERGLLPVEEPLELGKERNFRLVEGARRGRLVGTSYSAPLRLSGGQLDLLQ